MAITLKKPVTLISLFLASLVLSITLAFNGGQVQVQSVTLPKLPEVPSVAWTRLAQQRIWFGHQSVGYNIVEGLQDVLAQNPQIQLKVEESQAPWQHQTPAFTHFVMGHNSDPQSKLDGFAEMFTNAAGSKPDVAFFELCYVDIASYTPDVARVFESYKTTLARLQQAHPNTTFVPVTVALTTEPGSADRLASQVKNWVRKLVKGQGEISDNLARGKFNNLLRQEYQGKPLFDLAKVESLAPNGQQQLFLDGNTQYEALVPAYTDDGGHLNALGRRVVAEQLLIFLSQLPA